MTDLPMVEPKSCVKIPVAAIRPMGLKSLMEKELKREDHVPLKKNVAVFTHWLRRHLEANLPYERLVGRSEALTEVRSQRKDWKTKRNGGVKVAVVSVGDSKTKANKTTDATNGSPCFKRGDTARRVFKCTQVAPGERKNYWTPISKRRSLSTRLLL